MHRYESNAQQLGRIQLGAIIVAVIGIVFSLFGMQANLDRFFQSYLVSFVYWLELSLGCLGFLLIVNVVHGAWGIAVQRVFAAGARTVPLMALLFLPLLFALDRLYPWYSAPETLYFNTPYLSPTFFLVRAALYFVVWTALAVGISQWLYNHDRAGKPVSQLGLARVSAIGLVFFVLTSGFAAIDWTLSINPDYFASGYGWLANARMGLGAIALALIVVGIIGKPDVLEKRFKRPITRDLGMLLTATLLLWGYLEFIQGLIAWYGNLPWEAAWYAARVTGGWRWYVVGLTALHFAIPFALLIMPDFKQKVGRLVAVATLLFVMRYATIFWVVMPEFYPLAGIHWIDVTLVLGMGGLWVLLFTWSLRSYPLLPVNHPRLPSEDEQKAETVGAAGAAT